MFDTNQEVEFHYPVTTHVRYCGMEIGVRRRHLVVRRIRDLVAEPLTPEEFLRRPFVRRSRYLVVGTEIENHQWRQFYVGCSKEFRAPSQLRLALYEPSAKRPAKLLHRSFDSTVADRDALRRWLLVHGTDDFKGLLLRIYADDLRVRYG
jgi:hypothetical protein